MNRKCQLEADTESVTRKSGTDLLPTYVILHTNVQIVCMIIKYLY